MNEIVNILITQHGLSGVVIVGLAWIIRYLLKRLKDKDDAFNAKEDLLYAKLIEVIHDYGGHVRSTTEALIGLTAALSATKNSLDRIERASEPRKDYKPDEL